VQEGVVSAIAPFVLACLRKYATGELEAGFDGRYSAGALDLAAFLASSAITAAVDKAVSKRQARNVEAGLPAGCRNTHLPFVVQVRPGASWLQVARPPGSVLL
jgi:hypothetical protein